MARRDARFADERMIAGSGNVFVDLGFDEAEARVLAMRAELLIRLRMRVEEKGWTQAQAAQRLHVSQPRISSLMHGKWKDFSVDMLLTLAGRAGLRAKLKLAA
jgi:predicted XRE-type DNA-binding protein